MQTFEEQSAFFQQHRDAMIAAAEADGAAGVASFIEGFSDDLERRVLHVFARQGLVMGDWEGKSFDAIIAVADAGIAEILRQAEAESDEAEKAKRRNGAHVISFNLAADLADCWPGDDDPRSPAHHERGVRAADDCLGWCAEENLHGLAADHWVKGAHQIALGDATGAAESFGAALDLARKLATGQDKPDTIGADGDFGVILYSGYLGIAAEKAGDAAGGSRYDRAVAAFREQLGSEETKDDAEFGIAQLEKVRTAHGA